MAEFCISDLPVAGGALGICPIPGRNGDYAGDLARLIAWAPGLVLTMTTAKELKATGAGRLGQDLARAEIAWRHLAVADFGAPGGETALLWPAASQSVRAVLAQGGRVLAHCFGGCGRSGMAVLRVMIEAGEAPEAALLRLRSVRPCAVETEAQRAWAQGEIGV